MVSLAVFLSAAGFVNATIMQMPRSFYAMAADGVLPRAFLRVNPRTQVHEVGLAVLRRHDAAAGFPARFVREAAELRDLHRHADVAVVASTLFVLRRRRSGDGGFAVPGYPLLPAIYLVCLLGVATSVSSHGSRAWRLPASSCC